MNSFEVNGLIDVDVWVGLFTFVNHEVAFECSLSGAGAAQAKLRSRHNEKQ